MRASHKIEHVIRFGLVLILAALGLTACGSDMDELDAYINEVKQRPGDGIAPLPEIMPYEAFTYRCRRAGIAFAVCTGYAAGEWCGSVARVPISIVAANTSRAFLWIRSAWLERCTSVKQCMVSYKPRTV